MVKWTSVAFWVQLILTEMGHVAKAFMAGFMFQWVYLPLIDMSKLSIIPPSVAAFRWIFGKKKDDVIH